METPPPGPPRRRVGRVIALALLAALALGGGAAWYAGHLRLPDEHNPWAPLQVSAAPNWLTGHKLRGAMADPARCRAALEGAQVPHEPVPDRVTGPGCGFENAVRISGGRQATLTGPVVLSCPSALGFVMWERHSLQPAAQARLGASIARIEHLGSYACRNVNTGDGDGDGAGTGAGRRSRHATADALDVAGFIARDGRRVEVRRDWPRADAPEGRFLREVHGGACRWFSGVLGPDYNAVHADHLHLETGGWRLCR